MDDVLSPPALEEFRTNGFVRTGISLSHATRDRLLAHFRSGDARGAPVSTFLTHSTLPSGNGSDYQTSESAGGVHERGFAEKLRAWIPLRLRIAAGRRFPFLMHRFFRRNIYARSTYGSSDLIEAVLDECLAQGLGRHLAGTPLLIAHDIFLENTSEQKTFGFHGDGWTFEIFYQTDDDLTVYVPLHDTTEASGGRLKVERAFHTTERFRHRNRMTRQIGDVCQKVGCVDEDGYATREAVARNPDVLEEYYRLSEESRALPQPDPQELQPIDAQAGEVLLFNNKCFHDVEPWSPRNPHDRAIYIIRCIPLYDVKLRPPTAFLDGIPCNRQVLDPGSGTVVPFAARSDELERLCVPFPD